MHRCRSILILGALLALAFPLHAPLAEEVGEEEIEGLVVAAQEGDVVAQYALGEVYRNTDPPHDLVEAAMWYRKAAIAGYPKAQFALAVLYSSGRLGVPRDLVQSYAWLSLAAAVPEEQLADPSPFSTYEKMRELVCVAYGSSECSQQGVVYLFLKTLTSSMTQNQIAEGEQMARELWKQPD